LAGHWILHDWRHVRQRSFDHVHAAFATSRSAPSQREQPAPSGGFILSTTRGATVVDQGTVAQEQRPLILVVDDFDEARAVYAELLSRAGFRVAQAVTGLEAIQMTFDLQPALVMMDLVLPDIEGWRAITELRNDERTKDRPIVVVTGAPSADGARKAKQAGCDAFLTKPCLPETLLGAVTRLLGRTRAL
jgi:two-component system, cell cycle response regulator DivK